MEKTIKIIKQSLHFFLETLFVPRAGIEPARTYNIRGILSPLCLPVSPPRQNEASTRFELVNDGFANHCLTTWLRRRPSERRDSNPRPSRWQRDALPAELLSHAAICQ